MTRPRVYEKVLSNQHRHASFILSTTSDRLC